MNNEIKTLPNGDFEVLYDEMRDLERKIKEAMMIPTPLLTADLQEFEKHLPGVCERDFFSAPPGIADDMPECLLCEMGVPLMTQPMQHQDPLPIEEDHIEDFLWGIVKIHNGREFFLKKLNEDGTREWTKHTTEARLWRRQSYAEQFIVDNIGQGEAGVRGFMVGC